MAENREHNENTETKENRKKRRFGKKEVNDDRNTSDTAESAEPAIHANVLSLSGGTKTYENVVLVRIVSRDYNILILKDYMPTIGKVEGSVQIVGEDIMEQLEDICGYYVFHQNQFELLIEEDMYVK